MTVLRRAVDFAEKESLFLAVVIASFLARLFLAGRNSYWLDELYSVAIYGIWNDTAFDAVERLASTSVHPPLYQFVLFHWMALFGDGEAVTRTLSNVYMTGAAVFLYLTLRKFLDTWVALVGTAGFAFMYSTMRFGLETRSYAQTVFLTAVSAFCAVAVMHRGLKGVWKGAFLSVPGLGLVAANLGLLLTHYYNAFFIVAQGLVVLIFAVVQIPRGRRLAAASLAMLLYLLPVAGFGALWGGVLRDAYDRRAGDFAVDNSADVQGPFALFETSVLRFNITSPLMARVAGAMVLAVLIWSVIRISRNAPEDRARWWSIFYLTSWAVLPLVATYLAFSLIGVARYSSRYFIFSGIPLFAILALGLAQLKVMVLSRMDDSARARWTPGLSALLVAVVVLVASPGTWSAATMRKHDWRGTAATIVGMIEANPDDNWVVLETSFRSTPVLDYHLARYSNDIRVAGTIRRSQERSGNMFVFETPRSPVSQGDYVIVPFIHHTPRSFPNAVTRLGEVYTLHLWQIGLNQRGLAIYRAPP